MDERSTVAWWLARAGRRPVADWEASGARPVSERVLALPIEGWYARVISPPVGGVRVRVVSTMLRASSEGAACRLVELQAHDDAVRELGLPQPGDPSAPDLEFDAVVAFERRSGGLVVGSHSRNMAGDFISAQITSAALPRFRRTYHFAFPGQSGQRAFAIDHVLATDDDRRWIALLDAHAERRRRLMEELAVVGDDAWVGLLHVSADEKTRAWYSHVAWGRETRLLLPRADQIWFIAESKEDVVRVDWSDAERVVGHLMSPSPHGVDLVLVDWAFPSDLELQQLRAVANHRTRRP